MSDHSEKAAQAEEQSLPEEPELGEEGNAYRMIHYSLYSAIVSTVLAIVIVIVYSQISSSTPSPLKKIDRMAEHYEVLNRDIASFREVIERLSDQLDALIKKEPQKPPLLWEGANHLRQAEALDHSVVYCLQRSSALRAEYQQMLHAFYQAGSLPQDPQIVRAILAFNEQEHLVDQSLVMDLTMHDFLLFSRLVVSLTQFVQTITEQRVSLIPSTARAYLKRQLVLTKETPLDSSMQETLHSLEKKLSSGLATSDIPFLLESLDQMMTPSNASMLSQMKKEAAKIYLVDSFMNVSYLRVVSNEVYCAAQTNEEL